ncbi:protein NODULATION SIGNALING PATHWAY 2-like [Andrographis paniculata]|uniref:protein NODULATION SIGNALING PATHWAY 2-like n=1 Tax=Andrographis paniculata TaxID=175694 RepID=UPI0021E9096E|nr:protein NODULATION SIGNALING PATHWAY 2-like [Andrographis paniculata]
MIEPELLLPSSWQPSFITTPSPSQFEYGDQVMEFCDFPCSFPSPEAESSVVSSSSDVPTMFPDEFLDLDNWVDGVQMCSPIDTATPSEKMEEDIYEWVNGNDRTAEGNCSSLLTTDTVSNEGSPCVSVECNHNPWEYSLTGMEKMKMDEQLSLIHLLKAYGEAMENGEEELAEVIVKSINEKSSPVGNTMERLAYNLFQSRDHQGEYLRLESSKNFLPAFKVLCQSLPNSQFAHFTATTAILKSMPHDVEKIRIIDFHLGEGIQWPPLIEALSRKRKQVWITSVRPEEGCIYSCWNYEDTMKRLMSHARQYGVKLQMEEKSIGEISSELMREGTGGRGEWVVFNCMLGLPHMGGRRRTRTRIEFLKVARGVLQRCDGIVVLGDGEAGESLNDGSSYSLYFDHLLRHYRAIFESLEKNFPVYLVEARTAMENLFLSPLMCPKVWFQEWKEMKDYSLLSEMEDSGMEGVKHSQESLAVAKLMVDGGDSSYNVKIGSKMMVLLWKETPLVRVSTWGVKEDMSKYI